jgi:hypothetical protein
VSAQSRSGRLVIVENTIPAPLTPDRGVRFAAARLTLRPGARPFNERTTEIT